MTTRSRGFLRSRIIHWTLMSEEPAKQAKYHVFAVSPKATLSRLKIPCEKPTKVKQNAHTNIRNMTSIFHMAMKILKYCKLRRNSRTLSPETTVLVRWRCGCTSLSDRTALQRLTWQQVLDTRLHDQGAGTRVRKVNPWTEIHYTVFTRLLLRINHLCLVAWGWTQFRFHFDIPPNLIVFATCRDKRNLPNVGSRSENPSSDRLFLTMINSFDIRTWIVTNKNTYQCRHAPYGSGSRSANWLAQVPKRIATTDSAWHPFSFRWVQKYPFPEVIKHPSFRGLLSVSP